MRLSRLMIIGALCLTSLLAKGQAVATLEEPELLMGTIGTIHVNVPLPNDTSKVEFPLLRNAELQKKKYVAVANDSVELLVSHKKAIENEGDKFWMRYDLKIQAFDSGRYEIPALDFIVDGKQLSSNPLELSVLPVKVKADDKIDDFTGISEPFELNPNPDEMLEEETSVLLWWIIGAAILLLLAGAGFLLYKKNGRIFPMPRIPEPYEVAILKLNKLKSQKLPQKGKTKEYYTRLTDILRSYLKKQFSIKTAEKTSSEILAQVAQNEHVADYENLLRSIFETSDFVKFAKVNPSEVENDRCMKEAVRFVEVSHPVDNEEEKGGGK